MIAPDDGVVDPWLSALTKEVAKLNESDPIDHVLITMPPYGMASLAGMIKDTCPAIPVTLDLRDPWAFDGAFAYPSKSHWRQNMSVMRLTLQRVDGVVVNTPEVLNRIQQEFEGIDPSKLAVVTNGYELDLFESAKPPEPQGYVADCVHLVHVGTLHSQAAMRYRGLLGLLRRIKTYRAESADLTGRTAKPVLAAIAKLKQQQHPSVEKLRLVLVGVDDEATKTMADQGGCEDLVHMTGYVPHNEAVAWLRWGQCLFLPLHGLPEGHRSLIVPGKTYEYLASKRPILGALPEGDAKDLVKESGRAWIASPCDVDQLADCLSQILDAYQAGNLPAGQGHEWSRRFSRPELTQKLFTFLERPVQMRELV